MSDSRGRTRREILAEAAKAAAAASVAGLAGCFPSVGGRWPDAASQAACTGPDGGATGDVGAFPAVTPAVVEVHREESVVVGAKAVIQPDVVATMLDTGLTALANQVRLFNAASAAQNGGSGTDDAGLSDSDSGANTAEAGAPEPDGGTDNPWKVLLPSYQDGQRIGLKVNCLNSMVPTSPAIVKAIVASLRNKLGVDPANIVVWDRTLSELTDAKFGADDLAPTKLLGTLTKAADPDNPDPTKIVTEASVTPAGLGYGDPICGAPTGWVTKTHSPGRWPRLSRILTDKTDLTINCPVFKAHGQSGVTGAMKNIYGMIDNPDEYHRDEKLAPDFLNTNLPVLYSLPAIRNSICLTIVDALIATTANDTQSPIDAYPKRILLGLDPVAIDSYALVLLNQIRTSPKDPKLSVWLSRAEGLRLGSTKYLLIQV